jgi:hypothetical protein
MSQAARPQVSTGDFTPAACTAASTGIVERRRELDGVCAIVERATTSINSLGVAYSCERGILYSAPDRADDRWTSSKKVNQI